MLLPWAKKQIISAWVRRIVSLLSSEAPGFRGVEFDGDDTLCVKFSSLLDGAYAFPFAGRVSDKLVSFGAKKNGNFTQRINPNLVTLFKEMGISLKAPVNFDDDPYALISLGEGSFAGFPAYTYLQAEDFDKGIPTVKVDFFINITFQEEDHEELYMLCQKAISMGKQLGELLEEDEAIRLIIGAKEGSALFRLYSSFQSVFRSFVGSRLKVRDDFKTHVLEGHGVSETEVMEAIASQIVDPIREMRPKNISLLEGWGMRLTVLGLTNNNRLLDITLESSDEGTKVITAFEVTDASRIGFWLRLRSGQSSNPRLLDSPDFRGLYREPISQGKKTKAK